jgi:cytochrome c oxidase assembly protein subunit 15
MRAPSISSKAYHRVTLLALISLGVIIVTGAAVRLTGSGLGCTDWPNCTEGQLVAPLELNPMVEFVNRVFTGVVSIAVILAVLGSLWRRPRRRDLVWLSLGLVAGVVAQIVLGGITVLTDLHPAAVQSHFVLSIVIVWDALVLHQRAGEARPGPFRATVPKSIRRFALGLAAWAMVVVVTGTVVTGSGPHGGDEEARRFGFAIGDVARIHGTTVVVFLAASLTLVYLAHRRGLWVRLATPLTVLVWAIVLQGALGYAQYFSGVPALLVGLHVVGAVLVWVAAVRLTFATREPSDQTAGTPSGASEPSLATTS